MAATTHPSVFSLFCFTPDLMAPRVPGGTRCLYVWVLGHLSMPTSTVGTFMLSSVRQGPPYVTAAEAS